MHKENQIDEIARIIDDNHGFIVSSLETAEALYNAGYRKSNEAEWIWDKQHSNYKCSLCGEYDTTTPKFCRGCGSKMKCEEKKDSTKKYFSPEDVRKMSRSEVRDNYTSIMNSMKKWK